ncbi:MAG TPA: hypothetical protein VJ877_08590 [Bacteroidales bacterium]|nr:hypothetical protein [Bacteroidales bacterium]
MKKSIKIIPAILFLLLASSAVHAQFFRVYEYTTLDPSEKEFVYWTTYIPSSDNNYDFFGNSVSREGMFAHSLEFEYGLSPAWTIAFYMDFEQPKGENLKWIRTKAVMLHYSLFEKGQLPVDLALYGEYKLPRRDYGLSEELEFKLIIEKDFGSHRFVLNPTFEKKISGPEVDEGVEFALSGAYSFIRSLKFQPRIEYYSKMGELIEPDIFGDQEHYIFPSFDLFFGKYSQFRWHAGVGFGLTDPADNVIIKSILSWEFF